MQQHDLTLSECAALVFSCPAAPTSEALNGQNNCMFMSIKYPTLTQSIGLAGHSESQSRSLVTAVSMFMALHDQLVNGQAVSTPFAATTN